MSLSRILLSLLILIFVVVALFIAFGSKKAYELLPANLNQPVTTKPFEEWKSFTSDKGQFKVSLPTIPQQMSESVPDISSNGTRKYDMYISQKGDGTSFMISLIAYSKPIDPTQSDIIQEKLIQEWVGGSPSNVLKEDKKVEFKKYSGRDFTIENDQSIIQSREFFHNKTLYLLTYLAQKEDFNKDEFDHFANSFELLNNSK